jgi:hypothetical protein
MSGTKDTNWRSYVGPEDNGLTVDAANWQAPPDPENWDDLVKCSNCQGLTISGLTVPPAREDSIDAVRGGNYTVQNCTIKGSVTIKGSINGCTIYGSRISGVVELGQYDNYWTRGRAPTRNVSILDCKSPDGSPIRVRVWDADVPLVQNTNVKITKIPKWVWWPYFVFRRLTNRMAV